jgi:F420H(2)-dependent quinone reductase
MTFSARLINLINTHRPSMARSATKKQVDKYRSSDGNKGNKFMGAPCFLLDVVGRTSGESRPVMLIHVPRGNDLIVVGAGGGVPHTPNWYRNLIAAGGGEIQVGAQKWNVTARELPDGAERDQCWALAVARYSGFSSYQTYTDRRIPVAVLEPV